MDNKLNQETSNWNLDNSYTKLPDDFYSEIEVNKVDNAKLLILNEKLANELGIDINILKSQEGIEILVGNKKLEGGAYITQAYAGHQFGHFTMLGDGRAVLIGEQITPSKERYDIQLKGSGQTPYSRRGDGRAVLGPMLREYIISEAMHGLNIPTTRSLAVVKTGDRVIRETIKEGAILTRIAASHIRFGTFQYARHFLGIEELKELADYTINRHYPHIESDENKYISFLREVISAHASLVAKWQSVGFIHGVMNTDNMTISGETIDYGPCAFMDTYDPNTVFSSIDTQGRYSFKNQPVMAEWNLCRFAETLLPLIDENQDKAVVIAQELLHNFSNEYMKNYLSLMSKKIGIFNYEDKDKELIFELLSMMEKYKEDYTNTFISLTFDKCEGNGMFTSEEFKAWKSKWIERLKEESKDKEEVYNLMKNNNPAVIPRNYRVEEALRASDRGEYGLLDKILRMTHNPFEHSKKQEKYSKETRIFNYEYKTYCGT